VSPEELHGRERGHGLARPDSPTSATVSPRLTAKDTPFDGMDGPALLAEADMEVADGEDGIGQRKVFRGSKASRTPSKMNTRA
jgi:hypothetical protein